MEHDKSWLFINRVLTEYRNGLRAFIRHAQQYVNKEDDVYAHCFDWGWSPFYTTWTYHGEERKSSKRARTTKVVESGNEMAPVINDFLGRAPEEEVLETNDDDNIDELLSKLYEHVYPGGKNSSALKFLADLMHIKVLCKWSNESFDVLLAKLKEVLPEGSSKLQLRTTL